MDAQLYWLKDGNITSPQGFLAASVATGVKPRRLHDLALLFSETPAHVGAAFTQNQVKASPVKISMQHVKKGLSQGILINSGNANSCTGFKGLQHAKKMCNEVSQLLGVEPHHILLCSTGKIGELLPIEKIVTGIKSLPNKLSRRAKQNKFSEAILTTDTFKKECAVKIKIDQREITIGAVAKGSGMIHPNMATTLCVVTTDAAVDPKILQKCTLEAVEQSFNRISVDGDMSSNDTVFVLANGKAGNHPLKSYHPMLTLFQEALTKVMKKMARMVLEDGYNRSRIVELNIRGASGRNEAKLIAETIARSSSIKHSWHKATPNWGCIIRAAGSSGAKVREDHIDIYCDGLLVVSNGEYITPSPSKLRSIVRKRSYAIHIDISQGKGEYQLFTTDLIDPLRN